MTRGEIQKIIDRLREACDRLPASKQLDREDYNTAIVALQCIKWGMPTL